LAKSARSFLAIANKKNCGNLHRITFNRVHVLAGLKTHSFVFQTIKYLTRRCSTSRFAPWTAFKSRLCGFAAQKYSTKPQLKSCPLNLTLHWARN
jgi:hypothetical protein